MRKQLASAALVLTLALGLAVPAQAAPKSSYTSAGGFTVNVTPAPAALADSYHRGEGVFVKEENKTYTFYDVKGNTLGTGSGYTLMGHFHDGRAPVRAYDPNTAEERYGYIDKTGAVVISAQFDNANVFNSGRAIVKQGDKQFYIDTAGKRAFSEEFIDCYDFSDGIAVVTVPAQYTGNGGEMRARHGRLIDTSGSVVYDFPSEWFDYAPAGMKTGTYQRDTVALCGIQQNRLREGWLPIKDEKEQIVLMDKTGARRALPELNGAGLVAYLGSDRLLVQKNAMQAIIGMDGAMLLPYLYPYMDLRCEDNFLYGVTRLTDGMSHGIIDATGKMVVPVGWGDDDGSIGELVDGMAIGWEWDYTGAVTKNTYIFWTSDCPYGPGASGQKPTTPPQPERPKNLAYASTQTVQVDGRPVEFQMYALKDANGNDTNYVKLRDVAATLNGTGAQFEVTWDGAVNIVTGRSYTADGSEMSTPFSGNRAYTVPAAATKVNGAAANLEAIVLTDDGGKGYTYYKLRDLGTALGFTVGWSGEQGVFIQTR
ncbi:WG repeat-containing protein [Pseudoflavonifractor sp. 524-17]|uniref:WG repeat-containing protein n=1 Tax=Pseudoflavonifractor sp. 524-17 TaxID=2304577 RepID=UPI00137A3156|nr:WG repeat-containing protein [Pseudoflavonifractor sp. 524-17]